MDTSIQGFHRYLMNLNLDPAAVKNLTSCFSLRYYKKNEYFAMAGEPQDKLGFLSAGICCMYALREDGKVFVKDFITKDQFLLASFDPGQESEVYIQTLTESSLMEARYSDVRGVFHQYPDLWILSQRGMEKRFLSLSHRLESFSGMQAKGRYQVFREQYGKIERDIPQYLIASYLGITPTQLSRIRKRCSSDQQM